MVQLRGQRVSQEQRHGKTDVAGLDERGGKVPSILDCTYGKIRQRLLSGRKRNALGDFILPKQKDCGTLHATRQTQRAMLRPSGVSTGGGDEGQTKGSLLRLFPSHVCSKAGGTMAMPRSVRREGRCQTAYGRALWFVRMLKPKHRAETRWIRHRMTG